MFTLSAIHLFCLLKCLTYKKDMKSHPHPPDMTDYVDRAKKIVEDFKQSITVNGRMAQGFVETIPNSGLLVELAKRLYSASRYLDVPLVKYGAPMTADCSASAASNDAYVEDLLRITYYANAFDIAPQPYNNFPPSFNSAWQNIRPHIRHLDQNRRYYEPVPQPRYLEVEGDVDDVTFQDLISPVVRVAQDLIDAYYITLGTAIGQRGRFEVRAKYAPLAQDKSAVDHVILYVGPPQANGQRKSEAVVFIEDKRASSIRIKEWQDFAARSFMEPATSAVGGPSFKKMMPQVRKFV